MPAKPDSDHLAQTAIDTAMMLRCIELAAEAVKLGEMPFAALVCRGDKIIAQAGNQVIRDGDVTRHAELLAISEAQRVCGRKDLSGCTLYSTVEPCAMCSFPVRETGISRVVFAVRSPLMGGLSRWNVLRDPALSRGMPEAFGPGPEIVADFMGAEAEKLWKQWDAVAWSVIKRRGLFGGNETASPHHLDAMPAPPGRRLRTLLSLLYYSLRSAR